MCYLQIIARQEICLLCQHLINVLFLILCLLILFLLVLFILFSLHNKRFNCINFVLDFLSTNLQMQNVTLVQYSSTAQECYFRVQISNCSFIVIKIIINLILVLSQFLIIQKSNRRCIFAQRQTLISFISSKMNRYFVDHN